jgi:hypothetical protein
MSNGNKQTDPKQTNRKHRIDLFGQGLTRREALCRSANGFAGLALAALLAQ